MIYGDTNFPILTTRRVVVSTSNPESQLVKVEFLIRSQEPTALSTWLQDSFKEYASYLRINFMILDNTTEFLAGTLQNASLRYRSLSNIVNLQILRRQQYNYDTKSISFREVLENGFSTSIPVTDLSIDYYHDVYGEIEIPIEQIDLEDIDRLHLIGFMHMDVDSYLRDKGEVRDPNMIDPMEAVGGELIYDLLLEKVNGNLTTQSFREVFYIENIDESQGNRTTLSPYYGPAHYHDENNPGPGGYVGWMAGFAGQDMGPRLQTRIVRNNKVFTDIPESFEQSLPVNINFGFGFPDSSNSRDIESYINSVITEEEALDSLTTLQKKSEIVKYRESQKKVSVLLGSDLESNFINSVAQQTDGENSINNIDSFHGVIMGIDYYRLVRDFSKYGNIIEFHESMGNMQLVERLLAETTILNLEVLRERVTNNPHHYNEEDTLIYETFDQNQQKTKLVITNDPPPRTFSAGQNFYKNKLRPASSQLADISEIDLVGPQDPRSGLHTTIPGYNRFFYIKDYDLFHNLQFGNYRHSLDFTIEDGIYKYISSLCLQLSTAVNLFSKYCRQASIPVIKTEQGAYISGNYDYETNSFHESFQESEYTGIITYALNFYREAVLFLTGKSVSNENITSLGGFLSPESTDLEILNKFKETLSMLLQTNLQILESYGDSYLFKQIKTKGQLDISNSGYSSKARIIRAEVKNSEIIKSIEEGTVIADYSLYFNEAGGYSANTPNLSLNNYMSRISQLGRRYNLDTILPAAYLSFASSPFSTQQFTSNIGVQARQRIGNNNLLKKTIISSPKVISTYTSYYQSGESLRFEHDSKINVMRTPDSIKSNFINKGSLTLTNQIFKNAGVFFDFSSPLRRLKEDERKKREQKNCLELSAGIKEALKAAAKRGQQPKEVIDTLEKNYGNLNKVRDLLGPIYDMNLNLFNSLTTTENKISTLSRTLQTQEDKYKGTTQTADSSLDIENNKSYQKESAEIKIVMPGGTSKTLSSQSYMSPSTSVASSVDKYVLVKVEPKKDIDGVAAVNNGSLLRI